MLTFHPYMDGGGGAHLSVYGHTMHDGLIEILFERYGKLTPRDAAKQVRSVIDRGQFNWITPYKNKWKVDASYLKSKYPLHDNYPAWFTGTIVLELDTEIIEKIEEPHFRRDQEIRYNEPPRKSYTTIARLLMNKEIVLDQAPMKIFLSHKSSDKTLIRRYKKALESVGLETWLDEDAMAAGATLNRALLSGMSESCAAVFFITPNYLDDRYLATEIDYAITEKLDKGDRFSIITLVLANAEGNKGSVPPLLRKFVWKEPEDDLTGFAEIIRALPVELGAPAWKGA